MIVRYVVSDSNEHHLLWLVRRWPVVSISDLLHCFLLEHVNRPDLAQFLVSSLCQS